VGHQGIVCEAVLKEIIEHCKETGIVIWRNFFVSALVLNIKRLLPEGHFHKKYMQLPTKNQI
jgi:hypothetical protein